MAESKYTKDMDSSDIVVAKAKDFWEKYNKPLLIVSSIIIVAIGGWYGYLNFVKKPKEAKAVEAMFRAEEYFRLDSINKALNGDGQSWGFIKINDKYGDTRTGKLAAYYAGSCFIKLNQNEQALRYLKKFSTDSKPVQARAYKLMADAYADMGKNDDALNYYKKSAHYFEKDEANSADYLFMAAYFADRVMKNSKEAISLYKEIREKFPRTQQATEAVNYLAQLGVYSMDN